MVGSIKYIFSSYSLSVFIKCKRLIWNWVRTWPMSKVCITLFFYILLHMSLNAFSWNLSNPDRLNAQISLFISKNYLRECNTPICMMFKLKSIIFKPQIDHFYVESFFLFCFIFYCKHLKNANHSFLWNSVSLNS